MSRYYEISVRVSGFNPACRTDIENAVDDEAGFASDNWESHDNDRSTTCTTNLTGGEDENSFANRVAKAAMKANGRPCNVEVIATCLEDLPFERYRFSEKDFEVLGVAEAIKEDQDE